MSWRNELDDDQGGQHSPLPLGKIVSYALVLLAVAVIFCALQIGYSLAAIHDCTPFEASEAAWHWLAGGPIWFVAAAFVWVTGRAISNRLR